jgi:hypothetical protein
MSGAFEGFHELMPQHFARMDRPELMLSFAHGL